MAPTPGNEALLQALSEVSEDLGYGPVSAYDPGKRALPMCLSWRITSMPLTALAPKGQALTRQRSRLIYRRCRC